MAGIGAEEETPPSLNVRDATKYTTKKDAQRTASFFKRERMGTFEVLPHEPEKS